MRHSLSAFQPIGIKNATFYMSFFGNAVVPSFSCAAERDCPFAWRQVRMALPQGQRRYAEIQRLTKQLEELKARRAVAREEPIVDGPRKNIPEEFTSEPQLRTTDSRDDLAAQQRLLADDVIVAGKHGENSRFCPITVVKGTEFSPRIVAVAGRIPDVTTQQVREAPKFGGDGYDSKPQPGFVSWTYIPPGYDGEVVALPASDAFGLARDPIALRARSEDVAANLSSNKDRDALIVIDRDLQNFEFSSTKFYAWGVNEKIQIGWFKSMPAKDQAICLGSVLGVLLEENPSAKNTKSCWLEEQDD